MLESPTSRGTPASRGSLAFRVALLVTASCLITAVIAGTLAINLIRKSDSNSAHQTLSGLANAARDTADLGLTPQRGQARAGNTLRALKIEFVTISGAGVIAGDTQLAKDAVTRADVATLLAGQDISTRRRIDGQRLVIEGRGTRAGGLLLIQRYADATAAGEQAVRRVLIGLVIGTLIAITLGLWVARRIAMPLRRTADAAYALARGRRDVVVPVRGPAEVAEVGEAVNLLAAALLHSESRQRDFLLSVSHDLRTPLTAIAGFAESLSDGVVPPQEAAGVGAVMLTEAQRLNRLVGDLLDLARLGAQEFRLDFAAVDVTEVAVSAARVWSERCSAAGVDFYLQAPPTPLWCWSDASRLRQILDGLLENALRVTPAGAPIILAVGEGGAGVRAEVRDGGPGLTDDDLQVAFERSVLFERYRGVRRVGTGLGLAIVHGLVFRLGGTVEAGHSAEGGARFTVTLPGISSVRH